ncbi:MAG: hypothetical protein EXS01_00470 [Phycisphaerales bacterium]|nr:hypothetical protein [Phycisphaerales bacterium]
MRRRTILTIRSSPPFIRALALFTCSILLACDKPAANTASLPGAGVVAVTRDADLLIARSNCIACHAADAAIVAHAGMLPAPTLAHIGDRTTASWIAKFLEGHPHIGATGMRMPNVLTHVPPADVGSVVRDLAAYLASLHADATDPAMESPTTFPAQLNSGERLFRTLGCVGCHPASSDQALADESWLADKWTRPALVEFLLNPARVWPGGQMPNFNLSRDEAMAIASYLLRGQGRSADGSFALTKAPGVSVNYYEGAFIGTGPGPLLTPTRMDTMAEVDIPTIARADAWGARITATLTIPTAGSWQLWIGSDDGSSLSLDGALLMESPGVHGFDWKSATRELTAGPHELLVTYFEGAGNADLRLEWMGPGVARERIPASAYTREAIALRAPSKIDPFTTDASRSPSIPDGRALFAKLGCVQCHGSPDGSSQPSMTERTYAPLAALDTSRGCLAEDAAAAHAPDYAFTATERAALRSRLTDHEALAAALPASESLALHLLALNCTACHARDHVGQPTARALALFEGTADIGEQGRVPPTLTGAGAKLRTTAIDEVLAGTGAVRPYMLARMPQFGRETTAPFAALFAAADNAPAIESDPPMREEVIAEGRQLVGTEGFACIACHGCAGYPAAGVPAIDLSYTYARIRHSWFEKYMRNPAAIYPGTRMPTFWQPGQRVHTEILAGDPSKQIAAIWSYLALGASMPLPKGMIPGSAYELAPTIRPIVLGTFMNGLSARCLAVGFADQLHFVYDVEHRRTAKAWRGRFMDAAGTWFGRAGLLCEPAGIDVIDFPPGDAVAVLDPATNDWPVAIGRESGWQFVGVDRDGDDVPTFRTARGELEVEERIAPAPAVGGAHLIRDIVIRSKRELQGVTVRAWVASAFIRRDQGWQSQGGPTIFAKSGGAFVRETSGEAELLIPVGFRTGSDSVRPYEAHIRLEYVW